MKRFRTSLSILGLGLVGALLILAEGGTNPVSLINKPPMAPQPQAFPVGGSGLSNRQGFVESYGKLPVSFEINEGQTDLQVKFLARGSGYALFLTDNEAVLSLNRLHPPKRELEPKQHGVSEYDAAEVLHMKLVGANAEARVAGLQELPGKVNYFIGNDPKKWRTNVATYAKVKYENVYPGVDLVYYGNQGRLEYDFVVAPGADPNAIALAVEVGSSRRGVNDDVKPLRIDAEGDLVVKTRDGEVRFDKPVVYQPEQSDPPTVFQSELQNPKLLDGRYILLSDNGVHFEIPDYDKSRPLVIDPVLSYSTYLGGSNLQSGSAIAVDTSGNAYVTGSTESSDFPTMNPIQSTCGAALCGNAFVAKLNAAGNGLVYSTYLGGSGQDRAYGIAVDSSGNAYVMGGTTSTNFPTVNPFQAKNAGRSDAFVTKLNATGNALVYSTYLGGSGDESTPGFIAISLVNQGGIAVDSQGNAYVVGYTNSTDFPTANPFQAANAGGFDGFVVKFNAAGNGLVYSTYLGGSGNDGVGGIAVDSAGNAYVTGGTASANFPTASPFQAMNRGTSFTAFVTKVNAAGTALAFSTYLGGSRSDLGAAVAVDSSGSAYVTGTTSSTDFPTANPFQASIAATGVSAVFLTKFNATGSALVYSTYLGGSIGAEDVGNTVAVDSSGNAYVAGQTLSGDFPTQSPIQAALGHGNCCTAFLTAFNATGSSLVYSTFLGGSSHDWAAGIAVDSSGNAYVTGGTGDNDFPTLNPIQATCGGSAGFCGGTNVYVSKISPASAAAVSLGPAAVDFPDQFINTTSAAETVTLRNMGSAPLTITNISITGTNSGDFAVASNNCGAGLGGGGSCTLTVTFTPKLVAVETAAITVTDNGTGSPQSAALTGKGVNPPVVSLLPTSLDFGNQLLNTTSPSKTIAVTNTGGSPLTNIAVGITGAGGPVITDFSGFNTCSGTPLAVGANCTISINFTPAALGLRKDEVFINDNAPTSPQIIPLSGTGTNDFGVAVAAGTSSSATVTAGLPATYKITVSPLAGFNQTVNLSCTGAPTAATCTPSPTSVTLDGTNSQNIAVTVATTARGMLPPLVSHRKVPRTPATPLVLVCAIALMIALALTGTRRLRPQTAFALPILCLASLAGLWACGGGSSGPAPPTGTPAGTYTLTVTGTSGNLSHKTTVTLTVN